MAFVTKYILKSSRALARLGVALSVLLGTACTTLLDIERKPEHYLPTQRETQRHWYNKTYLAYYDLQGPVKKLRRTISVKGQPLAWEWQFTREGRLSTQGPESSLEQTRYIYNDQSLLREIVVAKRGVDMRKSSYHYVDETLQDIENKDLATGDGFIVDYILQPVNAGYYVSSHIRYSVDIPHDQLLSNDGELLWSSHSTDLTSADYVYLIPTHDHVTSPLVSDRGTWKMQAQGGYRYDYYADGRLAALLSYNANKHRLYHRTDYKYSRFGLLLAERKQVTGNSVFNDASDAAVQYRYTQVDSYGNWLRRVATLTQTRGATEIRQARQINYW